MKKRWLKVKLMRNSGLEYSMKTVVVLSRTSKWLQNGMKKLRFKVILALRSCLDCSMRKAAA